MHFIAQEFRWSESGVAIEWRVAPEGYGHMPKNRRANVRKLVKAAFGQWLFFKKPDQKIIDERLNFK